MAICRLIANVWKFVCNIPTRRSPSDPTSMIMASPHRERWSPGWLGSWQAALPGYFYLNALERDRSHFGTSAVCQAPCLVLYICHLILTEKPQQGRKSHPIFYVKKLSSTEIEYELPKRMQVVTGPNFVPLTPTRLTSLPPSTTLPDSAHTAVQQVLFLHIGL